jgi:hypothetical protein
LSIGAAISHVGHRRGLLLDHLRTWCRCIRKCLSRKANDGPQQQEKLEERFQHCMEMRLQVASVNLFPDSIGDWLPEALMNWQLVAVQAAPAISLRGGLAKLDSGLSGFSA